MYAARATTRWTTGGVVVEVVVLDEDEEVVIVEGPSLGSVHWNARSTSVPLRPTVPAATTSKKSHTRKWLPLIEVLSCVSKMYVLYRMVRFRISALVCRAGSLEASQMVSLMRVTL